MNKRNQTLFITMGALFTALLAVCSQIQIPLPRIPINLALFSVYLAGIILGPAAGSVSVIVYVLLGMAGIPVFAGFKSGIAAITGPTGGYIVGYIFAAFVTGMIVKLAGDKIYLLVIASLAGMIVCYALGTAWFMYSMKVNFISAFTVCILPFLPGDAVKIVFAAVIGNRLRRLIPEVKELNPSAISR